jgi:hypothetical protein
MCFEFLGPVENVQRKEKKAFGVSACMEERVRGWG